MLLSEGTYHAIRVDGEEVLFKEHHTKVLHLLDLSLSLISAQESGHSGEVIELCLTLLPDKLLRFCACGKDTCKDIKYQLIQQMYKCMYVIAR